MTKKKAVSRKHQKIIQELTMMDDLFFAAVMQANRDAVTRMLGILLERTEFVYENEPEIQKEVRNVLGRSIRLDSCAELKDCIVDTEVENSVKRANEKRMWFYGSVVYAGQLKANDDFKILKDVYVLFITKDDMIGTGEAKKELTGGSVKGGVHLILVNGTYRGDDAGGKLMHDFHCTDPQEMYYREFRERAAYLKGTEEGERHMSDVIEKYYGKELREGRVKAMLEGRAEGRTEGRTEGMRETRLDIAMKMLRSGEPEEKVRLYAGLGTEEIAALKKKIAA